VIVCSCNRISDKTIRDRLDTEPQWGARVSEVFECLGCRPQCGRCAVSIRAILREGGEARRACVAAIDDLTPTIAGDVYEPPFALAAE
jgi:bacterioferritin-associated ferredoxin